MIGLYHLDKPFLKLFALVIQLVGVYHNAHGVYSRGHMFGEYSVIFKHLQKAAHESLVGVHSVLFDRYDGKVLFARDTRYKIF